MILEQTDEERFNKVTNMRWPIDDPGEMHRNCPLCRQLNQKKAKANPLDHHIGNYTCDHHFLDRFGDMLDEDDWAAIKARRGAAFVDRWRAHIGPPSIMAFLTLNRQTREIIHAEDEHGRSLDVRK